MAQAPQEVIITTKNTASLTLGIISLVLGVLVLLVGWIPFLGLLAIPVAIIGGLLALIGIFIALAKGLRGMGLPILGGLICVGAFILPLVMTGSASVAISETMDEVSRELEQQRQTLKEEEQRKQEQEEAEKAAYILDHLDLYDVDAKFMNSILDGKVPGVLFKLKNNGDRSLDKVEVTFYFKDSEGNIIAEDEYLPVLVSPYSFSDDNKPLKPGYVWQMESGKFYSAKSVPSEWDEGNVEATITDIRFTEQPQ